MVTYMILNTVVLIIIIAIAALSSWRPTRAWLLCLIVLLLLTAMFDSLIIHFNIVGYNLDKIVGIYIGKAPIEDFFYTIAAALLVPVLWHALGQNNKGKRS